MEARINIQQLVCNIVVCGVPTDAQKEEIKREMESLFETIKNKEIATPLN